MFKSSIVAIVTPMTTSGDVDYDSLLHLIDWHIASGTDGIVLLGTTGESATILPSERAQLIECAVAKVNGRVTLTVGTGTNATASTIAHTMQAKELGADAALIVTPYYNRPTQRGLYLHFKAVAEAVQLPQILYNVPSRTGCDLLPETVFQLAKLPNIVALKEATGDLSRVDTIRSTLTDFTLLSGDDKTACQFIQRGGHGVVSVAANVVPALFHKMCAAAIEGDIITANAVHQQLQPLFDALACQSNPIPVKYALQLMHRIPEGLRLPLTTLSAEHHAALAEALVAAGVSL